VVTPGAVSARPARAESAGNDGHPCVSHSSRIGARCAGMNATYCTATRRR
jgi:hypothetical protein